jgi:hypothetical protein
VKRPRRQRTPGAAPAGGAAPERGGPAAPAVRGIPPPTAPTGAPRGPAPEGLPDFRASDKIDESRPVGTGLDQMGAAYRDDPSGGRWYFNLSGAEWNYEPPSGSAPGAPPAAPPAPGGDALYNRAVDLTRDLNTISANYLRQELGLGTIGEARDILDRMEANGVVGAPDANGRRFVTKPEILPMRTAQDVMEEYGRQRQMAIDEGGGAAPERGSPAAPAVRGIPPPTAPTGAPRGPAPEGLPDFRAGDKIDESRPVGTGLDQMGAAYRDDPSGGRWYFNLSGAEWNYETPSGSALDFRGADKFDETRPIGTGPDVMGAVYTPSGGRWSLITRTLTGISNLLGRLRLH